MARLCVAYSIQGFFFALGKRYKPRRPRRPDGSIELPVHLQRGHNIDRLVLAGVASLEEIRRSWDICEVFRYNELLDVREDVEWLSSQKPRNK